MAISRAQLLKELLPGLNALFGLEYATMVNNIKRSMKLRPLSVRSKKKLNCLAFSAAPVKNEGSAIAYDNAQEAFTARYTHVTIAQGFSLTEEAIEDNLYDSLSGRYTKALARSMAYTKQVRAASVLNTGFTAANGGDGQPLFALHTHLCLVAQTLTNLLFQLTLTKLPWKLLLFRSLHGRMSVVC
jgi:hypothetical protein